MADKQPAKTKRRVKNPETFRERAVKASAEADKPKRTRHLRAAGSKVVRPASRASRRLFDRAPFKWLKRPFGVIGRIIFPRFLRNAWQELRLVTWPSWKESRRLTYAVLIFAVVFGAAIAGVDFVLDKVFKALILR